MCVQSDLVGASIAEPPRPHHRSLDKGVINAILGQSTVTSVSYLPCYTSTIQHETPTAFKKKKKKIFFYGYEGCCDRVNSSGLQVPDSPARLDLCHMWCHGKAICLEVEVSRKVSVFGGLVWWWKVHAFCWNRQRKRITLFNSVWY